jgi:hypothetical protein
VILAVDPGTTETAWLVYAPGSPAPIGRFGKDGNESFIEALRMKSVFADCQHMAVEMIASYGMAVGKEVFDTCVWIGRMIEAWGAASTMVYRRDVKLHLCHSARANDSNIRAALIDRFGPPGTKRVPGVTYGLSGDTWSALGVAVTYAERGLQT